MKKRIGIVGVALALFLTMLAGCGGKSGNDAQPESSAAAQSDAEAKPEADKAENSGELVVIKYPTHQIGVNTAAPVIAQLVEEFNQTYQGKYEIQVEEIPGDANYVDKIKVLLGTDSLPPVVYTGGYNVLDLALAKDALVDLTEYVDADADWKKLYTETSITTNSRDGKIYASSSEGSIVGYFYNKELFEKAGIAAPATTWEEFFAQCEQLKAAGITPLSMDTADSAWVTQLWMGAMVATANDAGYELMKQMNPTDYNTPEMVQAVANVQKMLQEYTTPDAIGGKYEHAANNFFSGNVAMIANGPWMIGDFADTTKAPEGFADKVGVAVYPGGFVYDAPIQGFMVTNQEDPKLVEASIEMVKFFTNEHAQQLALETQGMVPASPTVEITDAAKEKFPLLVEFLNIAEGATLRSDNMQATMYPNLLDIMSQQLPLLAAGSLSPEDFCQILTEGAQKNQ